MKKVLISIAGVLMIAVIFFLFINARRSDKTAPCCPEAATTEVVSEVKDKVECTVMTGCQQTCPGASSTTK